MNQDDYKEGFFLGLRVAQAQAQMKPSVKRTPVWVAFFAGAVLGAAGKWVWDKTQSQRNTIVNHFKK